MAYRKLNRNLNEMEARNMNFNNIIAGSFNFVSVK